MCILSFACIGVQAIIQNWHETSSASLTSHEITCQQISTSYCILRGVVCSPRAKSTTQRSTMCHARLQGISSKGAASIAAAIQGHQSLQQLVMAHNHLSDEGGINIILNAFHHCGHCCLHNNTAHPFGANKLMEQKAGSIVSALPKNSLIASTSVVQTHPCLSVPTTTASGKICMWILSWLLSRCLAQLL